MLNTKCVVEVWKCLTVVQWFSTYGSGPKFGSRGTFRWFAYVVNVACLYFKLTRIAFQLQRKCTVSSRASTCKKRKHVISEKAGTGCISVWPVGRHEHLSQLLSFRASVPNEIRPCQVAMNDKLAIRAQLQRHFILTSMWTVQMKECKQEQATRVLVDTRLYVELLLHIKIPSGPTTVHTTCWWPVNDHTKSPVKSAYVQIF
jgi:hypothetical protein